MRHVNGKVVAWLSTAIACLAVIVLVSELNKQGEVNEKLEEEKDKLAEEKDELDGNLSELEKVKDSVEVELEKTVEEVQKAKKKAKEMEDKANSLNKKVNELDSEVKEKDQKIKSLSSKKSAEKKVVQKVNSVNTSGTTAQKPKSKSKTTKTAKATSKKTITMQATYYTMHCHGCTGRTASGLNLSRGQTTHNGYRVIAADTSILPLHTVVKVTNPDGSSYNAIVMDRGGDIKGNRIDVLTENKAQSRKNGRHNVTIEVLSYGDNSYKKIG